MAFPTPPSSARRNSISMGPSKKLPYYEDVYGNRNADEDFDRFPDHCEDESTSEDEANAQSNRKSKSSNFFNPFTTPKRNNQPRRVSYDRNSTISPLRDKSSNPFKEFTKCRRGSSTSATTSSPSSQSQNFFKKFNESRAGFTTNTPSSPINTKHETSSKAKKLLIPEKYGMFSSPPASPGSAFKQVLEQDSLVYETAGARSNADEEGLGKEMTNYAGEMMDDLLRFGGLDNLDDGFPTLDEDVDSFEALAEPTDLLPPATAAQSEFDGDVEDNASETGDKGHKNGEMGDIPKSEIEKRAGSVVAVRKKKAQKPVAQPRRSKRQEQITQSKHAAEKQAGRRARRVQPSKAKAAEVMAKNRSKMTTRAVSLPAKAKKGTAKVVPKGKSGGRARNWNGGVFDAEEGSVVVLADEADATEYIRY